jgi:hypothetical protein
MFSFRLKTGKNAALNQEGGVFADVKALGRIIGAVTPNGEPSEFDGDGDGFRTGPTGEDNVPVTKPVKDVIEELWGEKQQKALERDESRLQSVIKKLKGRKPKHDVQRMRELLVGARNKQDAIDARKITRAWAKSIFEMDGIGENGDYKVRLYSGTTGVTIMGRNRSILASHDDHPYPHVRISGEILDKDNKHVGLWERHIYLDNDNAVGKPHVYHEVFRMDDANRGKGVGADFTLATESMYGQLGIDEIQLNAGLADGGYTWLRAGYNFKDDKERTKLAKQIEERYKQMLQDAGSKEKLVAGGFMTAVGRHHSDREKAGTPQLMPTPMFESMEELDKFLKILGQVKTHPVGSERQMPPMALTMFGNFSRRILRGTNFDVQKPVRSPSTETKSLKIYGLDKLVTRV